MQKPPQKQERWFRRFKSRVATMRTTASQGLHGVGGSTDTSLGLVLVTEAAANGSDFGAYTLGKAFFYGDWGLTKDPVRARFWFKKVADGECEHKHLDDEGLREAACWVEKLEEEA